MVDDGDGGTPVSRELFRRVVVATVVGNVVEWYDNAVYGIVALVLAGHFFPNGDTTVALLATYAGFATAYVVRPVGALVFGRLADTSGRRNVLALTIVLMSTGTVLIGVLPTYAAIGVTAPVVLLLSRIIQGLGAGGEYTTATTFILEHGPRSKEGQLAGYAASGVYIGTVMATVLVAGLSAVLSDGDFSSWGWRVPFLVAAPLAVAGYLIRARLDDTAEFKSVREEQTRNAVKPKPFVRALREHWITMLLMTAVSSAQRATTFALTVYFIKAFVDAGFGDSTSYGANAVANALLVVFIVLAGFAADRFGHRRMLYVGYTYYTVLMVPMFLLIGTGNLALALLGVGLFALGKGIITPSVTALFVTVFPADVRATASAVNYNVASTLVGATVPLLGTWLYAQTASDVAVATYLAVLSLISLAGSAGLFSYLRRRRVRAGAVATPEPHRSAP